MSNYTELLQRIEQEPSTWLVTGVAGFIGSNLLQTLLSHGQRVVGLDNFLTGYQHNLDMVRELVTPEQWERFRFIEGDIRDVETCLQACQGVEHVLHEAALGSVPRSIENPIMTNGCNIDGFLNMLVAARDCGVKSFVYAASSSTYGDEPNLPKQEDRIGKPLSPYAVTKYVNELYAEVFARSYGFKTIGLRYFNVFGQRQDPYGAYAAVIPQWFAALTKGDTVYVNGDGETSRDFCYIDNVVQANLLASYAAEDARDLVYNVAFGQRTTLNELFGLIRDEVVRHKPEAAEAKPAYRDFRAGDVRHSLADITRARTLLGPERQNTGGGPYFTVEGGAATLPASGESCPEPFSLEPLMSNYTELLQRIEQEPSTWLVTGVAGFIGSNLLQTLLSHGQRVVGLDNFLTGYQHNLDMVRELVTPEQWERFRFIEGDIRDVETCLQACQGVEHVLHEAALGSVPRSIENPIMTNGCNIDGFLNMLVAARDCGVKSFVYAASSSTYGDEPNLPKQEDRIGKPLSPYAVTKYVNELYAEVFARSYGFKTIGLRYFNVFGQRQDPYGAYAAVIPQWFAALTKGDTVYVNGDGETSRDFCYIDNVVQANLLASYAAEDARDLVYNVAFGQRTTLNELFGLIRDEVVRHKPEAAEAKPAYRDFRAGDVRHSLADITRARTLLGYEPEYDVRQGLRLAGDWYDAHL